MDEISFLTLDEVLEIHKEQLALHGGQDGFLDRSVVESAVAQPQQAMYGQYLHEDLEAMAAAYLFHFAASQGFVDGNKRTAIMCMITFLAKNGKTLDCTDDEFYNVTMNVANNLMSKDKVAEWIRDNIELIP